jgi:hypothetical protein
MPLLRLLAINCAAGIVVALLALGGLLALNAQLRGLILGDQSPAVALALLGGGLIVTFASVAMGTAIMRLGGEDGAPPRSGGGGARRAPAARSMRAVPAEVPARHHDLALHPVRHRKA